MGNEASRRVAGRGITICLAGLAGLIVGGCAGDDRDDGLFGDGDGGTASAGSTGGLTSGAVDGGTGAVTSGSGPTSGSEGTGGPGIKLDVAGGQTDGGIEPTSGCDKVDFLFIIDNSISMGDEQQNLSTSFPDFIQTIQTQVVDDYHVMVIDTDPEDKWDEELTECYESDCVGEPPNEVCGVLPPENMWTCGNLPTEDVCDGTLGAGIDHDGTDQRTSCGITDGKRWFDDAQPDPDGTFECIANLYDGNSPELTMEGMLEALSDPLVGGGGCNEGFLRDDAVLVVTFISDEEDDGDSPGGPASWHADLLARKAGNETAVVVLGLLGDTSLPQAVCPPDSVPGSNGGEYSPRLIEFVELFGTRGLWGSVCETSYGSFFDQAVALIDTACDEYEPEG